MGLAVLPTRLKEELELLEEYILSGKDISSNEKIAKHEELGERIAEKYRILMQRTFKQFFQKEIGLVFVHVLEDAGVYKCTQKEEKMLCVLWTVYRTYSDRDYNECCSMKYKTTEQENIL